MPRSDPQDPTALPAWGRLERLATTVGATPIRKLMADDRAGLVVRAAGWSLDLTRQRVTDAVMADLVDLAEEMRMPEARDGMRAGEAINTTEGRAAFHMALRGQPTEAWSTGGRDIAHDVEATLARMTDIATRVRSGQLRGVTGKPITSVINIGIGGSDLGPAMAYEALADFRDPAITCAFVSNVDPRDIRDALARATPDETLVIVSSKTFTTRETMANAAIAREWMVEALGESAIARQFLAISTNAAAVAEFGISEGSTVGFWEWVGGRYSVDSAIGLSLMIAIGPANFVEFLRGFRDMDAHFLDEPMRSNLPVLMALIGVWNRTFLGIESVAVVPYSHRLRRFPAYLQQLTMESNGKSVRLDGEPVAYPTGALYWGEPGTNGQHSFFQLLHQGSSDIACDIIVVANSTTDQELQDVLVANALAQASVLSVGRTSEELRADGVDPRLVPHKVMPGNRPVSLLMTDVVTPQRLGALIALYEHAVFVQGVVWGINSFDQWGVELGKTVAADIEADIRANHWDDPRVDSSTRRSLREFLALRRGSG